MYNGANYVLVLKANQGVANALRVTAGAGSSDDLKTHLNITLQTKL